MMNFGVQPKDGVMVINPEGGGDWIMPQSYRNANLVYIIYPGKPPVHNLYFLNAKLLLVWLGLTVH